jgi:hypothetical protein
MATTAMTGALTVADTQLSMSPVFISSHRYVVDV